MGIKRTSSGRIYFDADSEAGNDTGVEAGVEEIRSRRIPAPAQTQVQIVALLGQISERLKRNEEEREELWDEIREFRKIVGDVEDKSTKGENAYLNLENKISRYERLEAELLKRQALIEKAQKEHIQKLTKASESQTNASERLINAEASASRLEEKLDETITLQKRLDRRLEKITQDRARMVRKMERLEEAVIETQDALRAKALVLLTDQSAAVQAGLPHTPVIEDAKEKPAAQRQEDKKSLWENVGRPRAVGTAAMLVAVFLAGWLLSGELRQNPIRITGPDGASTREAVLAQVDNDVTGKATPAQETEQASVSRAQIPNEIEDILEKNFAEEMETAATVEAVSPEELLDFNDEEQLIAAMESDPDALAAQLNRIEPATSDVVDVIEAPVEEVAAVAQEAPAQEEAAPVKAAYTAPPSKVSASARPSIEPDADLPEMIRQIETKAFNGSAEAQHDLAAIYTAGHGGVRQNYERAAYWFRKAGEQGVANARYNLGVLYHQGLGVGQDLEEAIKWYKASADLGHPEAQYNLGIAYIEGIGVPYDAEQAAAYFEAAANQQIVEAAYNLGLIHENGLLGEARPDEALLWYKTAADWGSPEGRAALEQLASALEIDVEEVNKLVDRMRTMEDARSRVVSAPQESVPIAGMDLAPDSASMSLDQVIVSQIQEQLMALGLYPGPADGVSGPVTADAIRSYEAMHGLPRSGQASEELLIHMLAQDTEGPEDLGQGSRDH